MSKRDTDHIIFILIETQFKNHKKLRLERLQIREKLKKLLEFRIDVVKTFHNTQFIK